MLTFESTFSSVKAREFLTSANAYVWRVNVTTAATMDDSTHGGWGMTAIAGGSLRWLRYTSAAAVSTMLTFTSAGGIGVFGAAGSTQLSVTTVIPVAVYTSDVGAEVNNIVQALRAYGLLA